MEENGLPHGLGTAVDGPVSVECKFCCNCVLLPPTLDCLALQQCLCSIWHSPYLSCHSSQSQKVAGSQKSYHELLVGEWAVDV